MKANGQAERRFRRKRKKEIKPRKPYTRRYKTDPIIVTRTAEELLRAIILGTDEEMYRAIDEAREYFRIQAQTTPP